MSALGKPHCSELGRSERQEWAVLRDDFRPGITKDTEAPDVGSEPEAVASKSPDLASAEI